MTVTRRLIGHGRTSEVFLWGEDRVLKLYYAGWAKSHATSEALITKAIYLSGAPAPAVYDEIELEGRHGIVYERLDGPSLTNSATTRPWTLAGSARLQAELHAKVHSQSLTGLPSQRARMLQKIDSARPLPPSQRQLAIDTLARLPDQRALCHGDFHPENIIISQRGPVVLDWTEACIGHPLADVARSSTIMTMAAIPPDMPGQRLIQLGRRAWHSLYLAHYCQLRGVTTEQVRAWTIPVLAARLEDGVAEEQEPLLGALDRLAFAVSRKQ